MKDNSVVLLTGNAGYIGTVMTGFLKNRSCGVVGLDSGLFAGNFLYPAPKDCLPDKQIIRDIRKVEESDFEGIDAVIHLAALSNDPLGEINPALTDEINFMATVRLAEICRKKGIKRFLFASSCSIYGISETETPVTEETAPNPMTAYAKAKVRAEEGLKTLANGDFHPVFLRNATVYGASPRLRLDLVVNNLLAWAYLTNEVAILSDGKPWRPVIHIEDFCAAFLAALKAPAEKIHSQVFNVGIDEENYRVKEIAEEVGRAVPASKVKILNKTGPDERSYRVDFSKIKRELPDFKPDWNLRKGIKQLLDSYSKNNLTQDDFNSERYFRIRTVRSLMKEGKIDKDLRRRGEIINNQATNPKQYSNPNNQ